MKKILILSILTLFTVLLFAEQYMVNGNQNEVRLLASDAQQSVLELSLGHFLREEVQINGETYWQLQLKKEGITQDAGFPQLPYVTRSLMIPGTARMQLEILESDYTEVEMPVAPSKGIITRDVDPDTVPWTFGEIYQSSESYPDALARLSEPFIIRDYRGITVYFQPFVYYPATQTLRIYTRIKLAVNNTGIDNINVMTSAKNSASTWFDNIYRGLFINYDQSKYPVLDEEGRILIITNEMFNTALQPYVDWKRQKGFTVNVVDITTAGPTAAQLKTFIQNQYNLNNNLAFVQIIGDHAQVPSLTSGTGASDPSFSLLAGTDSYPDIFVGRFSAQTTADLETQVTRTIHYERDMQDTNPWLTNATGLASDQGGGSQGDLGESDIAHMNLIRTDLLNYGYTTVDQIYDPGALASTVATAVNAGRGFINYVGHGSDTYWVTTGFSNNNVNQLTNDYKLPFIVSVACVNGNFANQTCFAEAWLRARNSTNGNPRGAMAFYGSTINQSWNSPMRGQDEITDLLIANQKNTVGGLFFNGSSKMIEVYGTDGINMFKTWHIFGDASLQVRTTNPQPMTVNFNPILNLGSLTFTVQAAPNAWVTLYNNGTVYATGYTDNDGTAVLNMSVVPTEPMDLTLTITGFNKITYVGVVHVQNSSGPYIQISNQVVSDNGNNLPEYGETFYYDLTLNNVGNGDADSLTVVISSTDQYITILDNTESFAYIGAGLDLTSTNGFLISAAGNVPDQHAAIIHVTIIRNGTVMWEYNVNLVLNAPAFTVGSLLIGDALGNNNGRIDAGETVTLTIPVTNSGHAAATDMLFSLLVNNQVYYLLNPIQTSFTGIAANETVQVVFELTFSSTVPTGTLAQFMLMGMAGEYTVIQNLSTYVGLQLESFDNGNFDSYPWLFTGGNWILDTNDFHSPGASAKSAVITHSQSTTMTVTMDNPEAGSISFWKKVSSEATYDFLRFYINNNLAGQWSGTVDWSQHSYNTSAGTNTFKWEYIKDGVVSSGSDCAWVDDIIFPGSGGTGGTPAITLSAAALDFGSHLTSDFQSQPLTITNSGTATLIGSLTGTQIFMVKPSQATEYSTAVNFVIPAGITMNFDVMVFPPTDGTYTDQLNISSDDPVNPVSSIAVTAVALPVANPEEPVVLPTALRSIYPNPFNPETTVSFSLKQDGRTEIHVYNILGQKIRTLVDGSLKAGNHTIRWNGKDDNGRGVSSGIYFLKMSAGTYKATSKLVLMK